MYPIFFQGPEQFSAILIVSDRADEFDFGSQRGDIVRHVGGAADRLRFPNNVDHRNGSLRRKPGRVAPEITVEYDVANHQQAPAGDFRQQRGKGLHHGGFNRKNGLGDIKQDLVVS